MELPPSTISVSSSLGDEEEDVTVTRPSPASSGRSSTPSPSMDSMALSPIRQPFDFSISSTDSSTVAPETNEVSFTLGSGSFEVPAVSEGIEGSIVSDFDFDDSSLALYEELYDLMNDMPPLPPVAPDEYSSPPTGAFEKVDKASGGSSSPNKSPTDRDKAGRKSGASSRIGSDEDSGDDRKTRRFKPFHEEKWNQRLTELQHFRLQHGHALVPHTYKPNPQLARWVKRQRRQYKLLQCGKTSTMTADRVAILEDVGFVWDSHEASWRERVQELIAYRNGFGSCLVPRKYADNPQLATWVKCQRRQYKLYCEVSLSCSVVLM
mmetsp:Transcript_27942/g.56573  ORF Transcript_27942/g.56573 Transcript_27942/m.56573 type:complete len:322 (+) Transcript_27942:879-1844(+)